MILELEKNADIDLIKIIQDRLSEAGYQSSLVDTINQRFVIATGNGHPDTRLFSNLNGVKNIHVVSDNYQLVSRKWKNEYSKIAVGLDNFGQPVEIGGQEFQFLMGPCSIENEQQVLKTVSFLSEQNVKIMRGGVFKPRTSPYAFRGGGVESLKMFHSIASKTGIKIISEVMEISQIDPMYEYVDIFQVGARNAQNYNLLSELGKVKKPVLLKRGVSGTLEELLQSAEYVFSSGNEQIILCERGIRTFEPAYRNTLDINAIPVLKDKSHLPVVVDPSHGIGISKYVMQVALASIIAGADGLLIEIHPEPLEAWSDGHQSLDFTQAKNLINCAKEILKCRKDNLGF